MRQWWSDYLDASRDQAEYRRPDKAIDMLEIA